MPRSAPARGTQTTRRTQDGKFNGITSTGSPVTAKKTATKKLPVPMAQRDLARGDATLHRVETRLERTAKRIDRM